MVVSSPCIWVIEEEEEEGKPIREDATITENEGPAPAESKWEWEVVNSATTLESVFGVSTVEVFSSTT